MSSVARRTRVREPHGRRVSRARGHKPASVDGGCRRRCAPSRRRRPPEPRNAPRPPGEPSRRRERGNACAPSRPPRGGGSPGSSRSASRGASSSWGQQLVIAQLVGAPMGSVQPRAVQRGCATSRCAASRRFAAAPRRRATMRRSCPTSAARLCFRAVAPARSRRDPTASRSWKPSGIGVDDHGAAAVELASEERGELRRELRRRVDDARRSRRAPAPRARCTRPDPRRAALSSTVRRRNLMARLNFFAESTLLMPCSTPLERDPSDVGKKATARCVASFSPSSRSPPPLRSLDRRARR